jgi:intracellular multiplication protein IcmK
MNISILTAVAVLLSAATATAADWEPARTENTHSPDTDNMSRKQNPPAEITAPRRKTPPLPPTAAEAWAIGQAAPLSRGEIEHVNRAMDEGSRGRAWQPSDVAPRISTLTVNLSPGASFPLVRTAPGHPSTVMFIDNTGAPWPHGAPPYNGNESGFKVDYIPDSSVMTVQAKRQYDRGSVTVYLKGLAVPVILEMSSGEADNTGKARITDGRLDLRIPQRGPQAKMMLAGQEKIGLNNSTLQAFLDGDPPREARRLKTKGEVPDTQVWQIGDDLYVRSRSEIRDAFELTQASGDGTWLYKLPLTPEIAFSHAGKTVYLQLALE